MREIDRNLRGQEPKQLGSAKVWDGEREQEREKTHSGSVDDIVEGELEMVGGRAGRVGGGT